MSITERRKCGNEGEKFVAQALEKQGFTIEQRNYQWRMGEIDLIARKKQLLVFVEVKTRTKKYADFDLSMVITPSKQHKIIATAQHYLALHDLQDVGARFDVALIEPDTQGNPHLTYIPDAFQCNE